VIACALDPNCSLYTGRKAVSNAIADVIPFYGPERKLQIRLERLAEMVRTSNAAYIMVESVPSNEIPADLPCEAVGKLQLESLGQLEEVWHYNAEGATIYRVRQVRGEKANPLSLR